MRRLRILFVLCIGIAVNAPAALGVEDAGRITFTVEAGKVFIGYNDVRIPGDDGTLFSLADDVEPNEPAFWRARLSYRLGARHTLSALVAPLTIDAQGNLEQEVRFREAVFPAGTAVDATYRFDSYRLTYRYELARKDRFEMGIGLTTKIRDAVISLKSSTLDAEKPNTGFVPLINLRFLWLPDDRLGLLLEGDALAAPQGRAEDLLLALVYSASDQLAFRGGYRILEGGADNDEVYTFALFHYLSLGIEYTF
jgi:hypothetical protein